MNDALLWERVRSGDADAFGVLYERHARLVQAFCLRRTADPHLAEDTTATVFLEAWRRRHRIVLTTPSAAPYLLGVATNLLRYHWRSRRRHATALERLRAATATSGGEHDDDAIARLDALRELRAAHATLRGLPRRELEALALVAWGELTYQEAAAALGVPVGTVRSRLSRARARLGDAFPSQTCMPLEGQVR